MKKLGLLLAFVCMFGMVANAQNDFQKGNCIINAGLGIGYGIPVSASAEWAVATNMINGNNGAIGVGPFLSFNLPTGSRYMGFDLGVKGSFHYQWVDKLDTYAGLALAFHGYNDYYNNFYSGVGISALVGARYYFWDNIGLYSELGGGTSYWGWTIGACFKL